ncbi:MAG TPA: nucleoside/nucleotide kinase family protein [Devosia sp.]|jgi:pantothenate kinase|nr:nucleoside/nucleotide kinase family protein [Devosia sp.]
MEIEPQTLSLTPDAALELLAGIGAELLVEPRRTVLGIAGGPGVGKSTMALKLVERLGAEAAYVPMDGFHMRHAKLEALGTAADKGMPHTFEGAAFAEMLAQLKAATASVTIQGYSRKIEDVVDDAHVVPATARLLVVEGNYLLLATSPWWRVRPLLDRAVYLEVPEAIARARLLKRHAAEGLFTAERNIAHVERVDLVNLDTVRRSRPRADVAIDLITES